MVEYYFDIETTGLDPEKDKIITIQRQLIKFGRPTGPIEILNTWDSSEKEVLEEFLSMAYCPNMWDFVYIGTNLLFDFNFINERAKKCELRGTDFAYCCERPHLDLKHVMILLNEGRFKGYSDILGKGTQLDNTLVPQWYYEKKYGKIKQYIELEAEKTIEFYGKLIKCLPTIRNKL
ncbi:MAG: ribonuclease H-like domain-containing protein [Candidatus Bathyarchaeota archaeon]